MSEFKVGDIVRCINVDGDESAFGVGMISHIDNIDHNNWWPIEAHDIDTGVPVSYNFDEIVHHLVVF